MTTMQMQSTTPMNMPGKIPKTDIRYEILHTIPMKEFENDHSYVYLIINDEKDYYIVSIGATIQMQVLWYSPSKDENRIERLWSYEYIIPRDLVFPEFLSEARKCR
jgi:hypothetical protein